MERFSWSDNLRAALAPCLGCLNGRTDDSDDDERAQFNHHHATSTRGPDYIPRARPDELEGLLADSDDAETLSLHSNIGRDDSRRRKRRRAHKVIRFFGFDLFGKPPVQLPEDDDDGVGAPSPRARTISASTLDSDASPLDPSTIDRLSAARAAEAEARLVLERRAKEERRRRRRERKAARDGALALALDNDDGEFEGFPVRLPLASAPRVCSPSHHRAAADPVPNLPTPRPHPATTSPTTLGRSPTRRRSTLPWTTQTLRAPTLAPRRTRSVLAAVVPAGPAQTRARAHRAPTHARALSSTTTSPPSRVPCPLLLAHRVGKNPRDSPSRARHSLSLLPLPRRSTRHSPLRPPRRLRKRSYPQTNPSSPSTLLMASLVSVSEGECAGKIARLECSLQIEASSQCVYVPCIPYMLFIWIQCVWEAVACAGRAGNKICIRLQ